MTVKVQLLTGFTFVAIITLALGAVSWMGINLMNADIKNVSKEMCVNYRAISEMTSHLKSMRLATRTLSIQGMSSEDRSRQYKNFEKYQDGYLKAADILEKNMEHQDEKESWAEMKSFLQKWREDNTRYLRLAKGQENMEVTDPTELLRQQEGFRADHYALVARCAKAIETEKMFDGGSNATTCRFGKWLANYKTTNPEILKVINVCNGPHAAFHASVQSVREKIQSKDKEAARKIFFEQMIPRGEEVISHFEAIIKEANTSMAMYEEMRDLNFGNYAANQRKVFELAENLMEHKAKESEETAQSAIAAGDKTRSIVFMVAAAAVVLALGLGIAIGSKISHKLESFVEILSTTSAQTSDAANEVATSSQSLAEGASEQAASLEETTASMEEISSMVARNTENSVSTRSLATKCVASADLGAALTGEMFEAVKSIRTATNLMLGKINTVNASTQQLGEAMSAIQNSSTDVSAIVRTINEIAFQTNILALNAAVEAARAGEAGAGFAVVADEVRSLAQRCATAATQTEQKVQQATERSKNGAAIAQAMTQDLKEVSAQSAQVDSALKTVVEKSAQVQDGLGTIVSQIRDVDKLMEEVVLASKEQTSGIMQVNTALVEMDKVTQSNAAFAEETASASEELNAQAEALLETVEDLNVMVGGNTSQKHPSNRTPSAAAAPLRLHSNAKKSLPAAKPKNMI